MTSPHDSARESPEGAARKLKERVLVFIVVFLGLLIVAGIVAVVLRIIYLSTTGPVQRAASDTASAVEAVAADRIALPAGAVVKSVSASGDRLAVHYEGPAGAGIAVIDLASGAIVRKLEIVPETAQP
ncbi:hypothetical protein [Hyphomicrobium sp. CS1GBMeth3]|uniref:hypothetical protein n=1 Tax=Hyphomicrobium sp. CS1GBMeth3 TaxID=1892845 RepID=UPI000931DECA|nr:hypothetical protein [Hyphomicrobium sp. CS1GBMeth3]